jgi:cysteinyl-tRNA synthetase
VAGVIDPYVSLLLEQRREARATKRFADSDAIRDALIALGLDIRDTPDGVTWTMNSEASA